jgi:hypothetical protein
MSALDVSTLQPKVLAPGTATVRLAQRFPTTLPPQRVWDELMRALEDSSQALLWVNSLSQVRRASPGALGLGASLEEHVSGGRRPVYYRLVRFEPGRLFQYWTLQGHPFTGGGLVQVHPVLQGSELSWSVEYKVSLPLRLFLYVFWWRFVRGLRQQLRELERGVERPQGR